MYELRASIFLPRLDSTPERSRPAHCHVHQSQHSKTGSLKCKWEAAPGSSRERPPPVPPHSEQSPAARPPPRGKGGAPASIQRQREGPAESSVQFSHRQNSAGRFRATPGKRWPSHYAPTQRDPGDPAALGGHSGLSTHLSRGHRRPPCGRSRVGPSPATGTATARPRGPRRPARPSRCARPRARSARPPGRRARARSPAAGRPPGRPQVPAVVTHGAPLARVEQLHAPRTATPPPGAPGGSLRRERPSQGAARGPGRGSWGLSPHSPEHRRPRPATPPRTPAGPPTRRTASGGARCPHSARGSAPAAPPRARAPPPRRLAPPLRSPAACTRRPRRAGPRPRPGRGPTPRPGTPPRGRRSGSVRPQPQGGGETWGRRAGPGPARAQDAASRRSPVRSRPPLRPRSC